MTDSGDELDAVWTPEGDAIVFVATTNRDAAAYANSNTSLFKISANGGEPVRLTSGWRQFRPSDFSAGRKSACTRSSKY